MTQQSKVLAVLAEEPISFQYPLGNSQQPVTAVPVDLKPYFDFCWLLYTCGIHTYILHIFRNYIYTYI